MAAPPIKRHMIAEWMLRLFGAAVTPRRMAIWRVSGVKQRAAPKPTIMIGNELQARVHDFSIRLE